MAANAPKVTDATELSTLTDAEFSKFQKLIYDAAGISMGPGKKALISSRLAKRLRFYNLSTFSEYHSLVTRGDNPAEFQTMVDLLTTNETYFFRESNHFDLIKKHAVEKKSFTQPFRVWSAASSSGEEAYSVAMVLDDCLRESPWQIVGTDISTRVLDMAKKAVYPLERARHVPPQFLNRYCLKGVRSQEGTIMVAKELREHTQFMQLNLLGQWPGSLGEFDIVFLRNVMIYFDMPTKEKLVQHIYHHVKPGGYFLIGHSESLNGIKHEFVGVSPSVYRRK